MKILIVDDERNIRESIQRLFELEGIESATAGDGTEGMKQLQEESFDAVILDLKMPGMSGQDLLLWIRTAGIRTPVIMISAFGEIADAVNALKAGANDYLIKPFDPAELIHKVRDIVSRKKLQDRVEAGARTAGMAARLVGESQGIRAIRTMIARVAGTNTTVLITGESGTGKEVVARELHAASPFAEEPFVAVNIGALPESLIESELFGYEKGAFTGADTMKQGLFELAGEGSLFLDEIGEMPLPLQVKLLRVLQDRKMRRLGGTRDIPIKARILSATNRDVEALVHEGKFREDLYYRLNVVRITVPALRERKEDIPLLAGFLLEKIRIRMGKPPKKLAPGAIERLVAYDYPGNIRELENILERAMIYADGEDIDRADIDIRETPGAEDATAAGGRPEPAGIPAGGTGTEGGSLKEMERQEIARALAKWSGNRTKAAAELGISRRTILYKIKDYGLK